MQIKSLCIKSYRSWRINDTVSPAARARCKKLGLYTQLAAEGCSQATRLQAIGWSRATYYRWRKRYQQQGWAGLECRTRHPLWTTHQVQAVLHLRQRYPLRGKRKLWTILVRD